MAPVALFLILTAICVTHSFTHALNLEYLDPTKLQTKTTPEVQQEAALEIIRNITNSDIVTVEVNPLLFNNNKDSFTIRTANNQLHIRASSGVAAVWGFNYYLKKYCKSHIGWQVTNVNIPSTLPEVDETVLANDRFRYYQNVCTASYSFVWWNADKWMEHLRWMALNGINLALAPIAQEAAWAKVYRELGMTEDDITEHFTGPAFLSWLRMGNVHGWGGPLLESWNAQQRNIQDTIVDYMFKLGMVPIYPSFNGHVPKALVRLFPNVTFHSVDRWGRFSDDYCCNYFLSPTEPLFKQIGKMFLTEVTTGLPQSHIYHADPFNEIKVNPWSTSLAKDTANAIFSTMQETDGNAVWVLQNWMFAYSPIAWPLRRVKAFLTVVPNGRLLVLDLQSEQWPQYDIFEMYYGHAFLWCMLHNFGGTLGMFGNTRTINHNVYEVRSRVNSTMIGIGLTPEGINQNYVVYDLMLESAWRTKPISNLDKWVAQYAERRYGCNATSTAWKYLLKSVYSFNSLRLVRGKYVITRRPSLNIHPWAWYKSKDLFKAFEEFVYVSDTNCINSPGYQHDLVDVTRQALQYRAEQLYSNILIDRYSNAWVFNASINMYLDTMKDMERILAGNDNFKANSWLSMAKDLAKNDAETRIYEMNARNQITLWGPNGEITDYACKQWAEMFHYYYIPRWTMFLYAALSAKVRNERFDPTSTQKYVRLMVEQQFQYATIDPVPFNDDLKSLAVTFYEKYANMPGLNDLPFEIVKKNTKKRTLLEEIYEEESTSEKYDKENRSSENNDKGNRSSGNNDKDNKSKSDHATSIESDDAMYEAVETKNKTEPIETTTHNFKRVTAGLD